MADRENTRAYYDECLREFTAALLAKNGMAFGSDATVGYAARYAAAATKKREETREQAAAYALGDGQ